MLLYVANNPTLYKMLTQALTMKNHTDRKKAYVRDNHSSPDKRIDATRVRSIMDYLVK